MNIYDTSTLNIVGARKLLFPYVYLDENISILNDPDNGFKLYFALLAQKCRIKDVELINRNEAIIFLDKGTGGEFPKLILHSENSISPKIVDNGRILELSPECSVVFSDFYKIEGEGAANARCFEVVYIGQSGSGKQKLGDRLCKHEKIPQIMRNLDLEKPDKDLFILAMSLEMQFLFSGLSLREMQSIYDERVDEINLEKRENEETSIAEAMLINAFKPIYNSNYIPNNLDNSKFFKKCEEYGITNLAFTMDTSLTDGSWMMLSSPRKSYRHPFIIIECGIHDGGAEFTNVATE